MSDSQANPKAVTLGSVAMPVRFSYLHAHTPQKKKDDNGNVVINEDTGKPILTYSAQIRVPKADVKGKAAADAAIEAAAAEFFGNKYAALKKSGSLKTPFRDGDAEAEVKEDPTLVGHWFFNCSTLNKPSVVGPRKNPDTGKFDQLAEGDIKSGDYGKVFVNFFGFDGKSKGVAAGLGPIQKLRDGDPLGNRTTAEQVFDDEDVEDDEAGVPTSGNNALL